MSVLCRTSRVKKRRQYEKKVKQHKKIIPSGRNAEESYGGERTGVRTDVVHSRKLG